MPAEATDSNSVAAPAGDEPMAIVPVVEETALARSDADVARQDGEQGDDAEEEEKSQLPEGFFDDPELDAKARGVEAPSVVTQRELEEGLKRFEKEMMVEREKAEEARNELDEDKAEELAAEEDEFQRSLQGRLDALRKRQAEAVNKSAAAAAEEQKEATAEAEEEDGDDSGSDVEFDWRA